MPRCAPLQDHQVGWRQGPGRERLGLPCLLRPAKGERLVATARVLHHGRSQALCACEIAAVDGSREQAVAFAQGTW